MDNNQFVKYLEKLGACREAVEWVKSYGGTAQECWDECPNGHWLEWLVDEMKVSSPTKRTHVFLAWMDSNRPPIDPEDAYRKAKARFYRKHFPNPFEEA